MSSHDPKDPERIAAMGADARLQAAARDVFNRSCEYNYSYNFKWLGRPIIQYPQDMVATQELIWEIRPDLIIETGIAHGGSLIMWASILELIGGDGEVLGVDIEIRPHNRKAIEEHPLFKRISMIEGSAISEEVAGQVRERAAGKRRIMVLLDSNHTHDHVLKELELYSPLVKSGSYLIVYDTVVEWMSDELVGNRPWGKGDNPWTAVQAFLKHTDRFEVDQEIEHKLLLTVAPGGYLRCVRD